MDLHKILRQYDNQIPVLEKDLCVPPQAPRPGWWLAVDTPLHRAVRNKYFEKTVRLWELGWLLSDMNGGNERPLRMMAASEDPRLRSLPNDVSRMLKAASDGRIDVLKQLFSRVLSPLMIDEGGQCALHQTISRSQPVDSEYHRLRRDRLYQRNLQLLRTVEFLLETKGKDHLSPLYLAASECHPGAVKLLLERKAKVRLYSNTSGTTPLKGALNAMENMNEDKVCEVVERLLEADDGKECIDYVTILSGPPLMMAANKGYLKCCLLLTRYGASVHATDVNDRGLLHAIARKGLTDFLQQILGEFSLEELETRASLIEWGLGAGNFTPRGIAKGGKAQANRPPARCPPS